MTINDQIRNEKLQYDLNREAAKISALSSGKIHKYEYLTGEEILPFNQQKMGKAFGKHIKTIEDQGEKQIGALKLLEPKKQIVIVNDDDDFEDKLLHSKEREILEVSIEKGLIK